MICYAVKDNDGMFWCGMNYWDKQLRKARLYNSLRYANEVMEDRRHKDRKMEIVKVEINEVSEMDDYRELIAELRRCAENGWFAPCEMENAADAIEQLARERNADHLLANGVVVPCRCVECKYKDGEDYIPLTLTHGDYIWCNLYDATMPTDGFCSYAKRKGGDE